MARVTKKARSKKTNSGVMVKSRSASKSARGDKQVSALKPVQSEMARMQEEAVKAAKYTHSELTRTRRGMSRELPQVYGIDRLVLQVRDPWWIHAYWELGEAELGRLRGQLKEDYCKAGWCLRVYDVTQIDFNGSNAHRFFDIRLPDSARSWYVDTSSPGRSWCAELGLLFPDGRFLMVLRSNVVQTPPDGPSWITDEEWMIPDELFARLYGLGFGFGKSSPGALWGEQARELLSSGVFSSPTSGMMQRPLGVRSFWLKVDCELIVYGATEPDASVYVQGKQIPLRPDGTFTLRFSLPDGKQVIDVKGISRDREEERQITPTVARQTFYQENSTCTKDI